ncbi:ABC-type glycerol-3-phosphate transport system substrate-binding protein [Parabacteroides sp. PF5-5]|uniref:nitrophenyl compound nitroreductase subunit ArsF family protein n=1 Tax=unclassified Parabacteroides TaxID=2649774 RepID=UPI002473CFB8|nr:MULTISPECIES: nitrophenyl compound nitroreductase subunit ArsF family protein [unclassified Parabacteroides]MDH6303683.1 ABC-type glycerol-3-phosphate transport system substrate-binding protein [Parabacteroides sp. PH5-39]MDH6314300.1 ABC-type glycerol-3-phosphate transport system substrate-binding protein [Parabacteroides sp. PF5-13]MDH6318636.1 ABC-type glycerol-3-phosphate transport system substrate-binding protein [Parabacteroides sp. PH5-13]MDH6322072.1 ABC-type glycerol-3-phosphate tra
MKKSILVGFLAILLAACGGNTQKNNEQPTGTETKGQMVDTSAVNVYYFHGKQRCKTCIAVGDLTEKTIKELYTDNPHVKFIEVKTEEEQNASLVEKYEVTWNALIIAKGNNHIEITKEAFANALNSPEKLIDLIRTEVDKRL